MAGLVQEIETGQSHSVSQQTNSYRRYVSVLLFCSLGLTFLAYPIARTGLFERLSRREFWHAMQYHIDMAGQTCDMVIFGDSTGLTGIDPVIVGQQTGLKTCVLSIPYMALSTTGTWTLDHFLEKSPAPRLILFANHARHLRAPALDEDPGVIDGWLLVDRIYPPLKAAEFFLRHPRFSIIFSEGVMQQLFTLSPTTGIDPTERTYSRDMATLREHSGYFSVTLVKSPEEVCALPMPVPEEDLHYLPWLRQRYENARTKVQMYVSPVRSCDANLAAYNKIARDLQVTPPLAYPPEAFADAWHLNAAGARRNSIEVAQAIKRALATDSSSANGLQAKF